MTQSSTNQANVIPENGFLRIWQILGNPKTGTPAIIPVSRTTWWRGVKSGRYPAGVKLSTRTTAWRAEDIRKLIEEAA
ncbi:helix-turn-helix transcriptional regulator [Methylotuvimicrobium buryatense]|uniref:AlpA family phage regulatory protein n=1 Tax=Methylotuvimicrobium buryatense TaxID=95641 RepID=A0A4P9US68_METBY|nr:AlpA family phage regulatory protein [Methylotuvimicrobium buryatense]QCW84372.1 AlpA family phage regulatory protein [Methylotuvimicrobium buryatense]